MLRGLQTLGKDLGRDDVAVSEESPKEERIAWASFTTGSSRRGNTSSTGSNAVGGGTGSSAGERDLPLLLLLGYETGLQVWDLSDPKVMVEVLSLRGRPIMLHAAVLPPRSSRDDRFATVRPVLAYCEAESPTAVKFMQLETSDDVGDPLQHADPVVGLHCTQQYFVVATETKISIYNSGTLEKLHELSDCCQRTVRGVAVNPVALGSRWLAYVSSSRLPYSEASVFGSLGAVGAAGRSGLAEQAVRLVQEGGDSVITLAAQGVNLLNQNLNGPSQPMTPSPAEQQQQKKKDAPDALEPSGIVKVVDLQPLTELLDSGAAAAAVATNPPLPLIAHFQAHDLAFPLMLVAFSQDGSLLATADAAGQHVYVFLLNSAPSSPEAASLAKTSLQHQHICHTLPSHARGPAAPAASTSSATAGAAASTENLMGDAPALSPRLIYKLQRGFKRGWIREISFSQDSRWIMFTSERGTVHVFPINPRGGAVNGLTHTSPTIRNASRFFTSSGQSEHVSCATAKPEQLDGAVLKLKYPPAADELPGTGVSTGAAPTAGTAAHADVKVQHHAGRMAACFAKVGGATVAGGPVPLLTITPQGRLIQHQLYPHADNETRDQIVQNAESKGGAVSSQNLDVASMTTGLLSWVPGVAAATAPAKKPTEQHPIRATCVAYNEWPLGRCQDWPSVTRTNRASAAGPSTMGGIQGGGVASGTSANANGVRGDDRTPGILAASSTQWLSQVEIQTHQSGHRKLWMGPQFQLATYPRIYEMDAASPTPTEAGGYENDRSKGNVTPSLWRFNDAITFNSHQSGSWPSTPEMMLSAEHQHLEARARGIAVVSALTEAVQLDDDEGREATRADDVDLFHMDHI